LKVFPPPEVDMPVAESVTALVIGNDDPLGQGRVRVEFPFARDRVNDVWLRVMTPNAGSSRAVSKNRGMVFVPEKYDQVMVGFEFGDPNRPYVMGSMFHGLNGAGGGKNNAVKSMIFRSGVKIVINDDEGSTHIEVPSGSTWDMDGKGNVAVNAPEDIVISGKNIRLNALRDVEINAGRKFLTNVVNQIITNVQHLKQTVTGFMHVQSGKMLMHGLEEIKMESPELYAAGYDKFFAHSDQSVVINSKGVTEIKGKEGTGLTNMAEDVAPAQTIDAEAVVMFIPRDNWKGEFGFDWMRIGAGVGMGQTRTPNDTDYNTIMGYYPDNNTANPFVPDRDGDGDGVNDMYADLKKEYGPVSIIRKSDAGGNPLTYYIPILRIYRHPGDLPGTRATADIRLQIEVMEEPDQLVLEYDGGCFKINPAVSGIPVPPVAPLNIPPLSGPPAAFSSGRAAAGSGTRAGGAATPAPSPATSSGGIKRYTINPKTLSTDANPHTVDLTIECIANFSTVKEIKAVFIQKDAGTGTDVETLAGIMKVMPNGRANRKVKKIVFVNVITDINNDKSKEKGFDNFNPEDQKAIMRKFLRQAFVDPVISEAEVDITKTSAKSSAFNSRYARTATAIKCYDDSRSGSAFTDVDTYLRNLLPASYRNSGHICIFYFNLPLFRVKADGSSEYLNGYRHGLNIVMGTAADFGTPGHELLHALKLDHIFEYKTQSGGGRTYPNAKHCFRETRTKNVMDYTGLHANDRHFLYNWQAVIVNGAADPEPQNYQPR